jgi:hypothetical protein
LYEDHSSDIPLHLLQPVLSLFWHNNTLLALLRQILLIQNGINGFTDLRGVIIHPLLESVLSEFDQYTWRFIPFNFAIAVSTSAQLDSDSDVLALAV